MKGNVLEEPKLIVISQGINAIETCIQLSNQQLSAYSINHISPSSRCLEREKNN